MKLNVFTKFLSFLSRGYFLVKNKIDRFGIKNITLNRFTLAISTQTAGRRFWKNEKFSIIFSRMSTRSSTFATENPHARLELFTVTSRMPSLHLREGLRLDNNPLHLLALLRSMARKCGISGDCDYKLFVSHIRNNDYLLF